MNNSIEVPRSSIHLSQDSNLKIMLDDADFARAQLIYYNYAEASINAIMDGKDICIASLPEEIAEQISSNFDLSLTAINEDGNMVVLDTRIQSIH